MDFVGPYEKQVAKQYRANLLTPLLAGWEFKRKPALSPQSGDWMTLARTRNWQLPPALRRHLLTDVLAVVITDSEELIQCVNGRFEQMTGYSSHEVIGQRPTLLQGVGTSIVSRKRIRQAIEQKKLVEERLLNYRKDQTTYWCHVAIWPIANRQKEVVNFIAFEQEIEAESSSV